MQHRLFNINLPLSCLLSLSPLSQLVAVYGFVSIYDRFYCKRKRQIGRQRDIDRVVVAGACVDSGDYDDDALRIMAQSHHRGSYLVESGPI